ncbi:shugoshin 1 isoform X1 [Nerophis lumbriciformis]|uniref:shugoshin 1 isoform X1 n=1 Tax=Nerophis lumbriciformis TaxID=546530 RepID=UPI002ADFC8B1|nr:shugoshin 1 isoform X1 [Nerophis lumbriciformis]
MARERIMKKPHRQGLEDLKGKMTEKRNKSLARAATLSRGKFGLLNKSSGMRATHAGILKGAQENNKALALALQAEKENVRQAKVVILHMQKEQQALFLHLLLLRKKLQQQEASSLQIQAAGVPVENCTDSLRRERISETKTTLCDISTDCAEHPDTQRLVLLPSTVSVRRRPAREKSRRRCERVQEWRSCGDLESVAPPPSGDAAKPQDVLHAPLSDPDHTERLQPIRSDPPPPNRKRCRSKAEPSALKAAERGRKTERAPLKKPWENPKPRTRSKSRDRSVTRSRAPPPTNMNSSLGFNDTFDFDCEEAVHVTPFKAKSDQAPPLKEAEVRTVTPARSDDGSPMSPSSESNDSLYVPKTTRRRCTSPQTTMNITTRRGRLSRKDSSPNTPEAVQQEVYEVSPQVEVEMKRIHSVLAMFGEAGVDHVTPPKQTSQRAKTCKKRVRTAGRGLSLCDVTNMSPAAYGRARCSTSVPARKRRCTMVVDYKEPSLHAKLRRGDKFTDTQFLTSPIFKPPPGRRSRTSVKLDKYNESFVGCR